MYLSLLYCTLTIVFLAPFLSSRFTIFTSSFRIHPSIFKQPFILLYSSICCSSTHPPSDHLSIYLFNIVNASICPPIHNHLSVHSPATHHPTVIHPSILTYISAHCPSTNHTFVFIQHFIIHSSLHPPIHLPTVHTLSIHPVIQHSLAPCFILPVSTFPSALVLSYSRFPCLSSLEFHPFPVSSLPSPDSVAALQSGLPPPSGHLRPPPSRPGPPHTRLGQTHQHPG